MYSIQHRGDRFGLFSRYNAVVSGKHLSKIKYLAALKPLVSLMAHLVEPSLHMPDEG